MYIHQTNTISEEFQRRAVDLAPLGLSSVAWRLEDSINLLEQLGEYVILGGDLYSVTGNKIIPMSENWSYEPKGESDDAPNSGLVARDYLDKALIWGQGKDILVDLVVEPPAHNPQTNAKP